MSQTLGIFQEAYRGLRARKLFWIVLILSFIVVVSFACIGIDEKGITLLGWSAGVGPTTKDMTPAVWYKTLFVGFGIGMWLTWIATILALVSTAGMFPNFLARGAIDLVLARPISRLRLFLTQYAAGLLFVTLQITLFCVASFLVIGLRGGLWEPGLFLAVPLVVCFFSYLFCVCTLLGLLTRSTVAALLLTLLFWVLIFFVHTAETGLLMAKKMSEWEMQHDRQPTTTRPETAPSPDVHADPDRETTIHRLEVAHRILYGVKSVLPKTNETIGLLERSLISTANLPKNDEYNARGQQVVTQKLVEEIRSRSAWWIIGTSLIFEAVILGLASWIFCRKDF